MTCFQVSLKISSYSDTWHLCSPITVIVYTIFCNQKLKKLWRGQEDQRKPRTSELFDSETLKQFTNEYETMSILLD